MSVHLIRILEWTIFNQNKKSFSTKRESVKKRKKINKYKLYSNNFNKIKVYN